MPGRRGERVAPPAGPNQWLVVFGTNDAGKGWENLCSQAAANTLAAWELMRTDPQPRASTDRQHRLKGKLGSVSVGGSETLLPQWQIEVTGGGRIWYAVDLDRRRVLVTYANVSHPKATD